MGLDVDWNGDTFTVTGRKTADAEDLVDLMV